MPQLHRLAVVSDRRGRRRGSAAGAETAVPGRMSATVTVGSRRARHGRAAVADAAGAPCGRASRAGAGARRAAVAARAAGPSRLRSVKAAAAARAWALTNSVRCRS